MWEYRWHYDKCEGTKKTAPPSQWYKYRGELTQFSPSPGSCVEWRKTEPFESGWFLAPGGGSIHWVADENRARHYTYWTRITELPETV